MKKIFTLIIFVFVTFLYCQEPAQFSIIYIIHGDGNYIYHDTSGNEHLSDEEILNQALSRGQNIKNGEVFIFHQGKASKFLVFPEDDARFYYFRDGKKIKEEKYRRDESDTGFIKELELYNAANDKVKKRTRILLYYGHEIPFPGGGVNAYNSTHPQIIFNDTLFAGIVRKFASDGKFDLIVLSSCNNGTPEMISLLSPYTKYIIASPEDLHLSQMNSAYLEKLDPDNYQPYIFARNFADSAFNKLKKNTLTVITISLYDTQKTAAYVNSIIGSENYKKNILSNSPENCDCSSIKSFRSDNMEIGITVFYSPPFFGKDKKNSSHSGWGCKNEGIFQ